jgi:streptogramin lyase
MSPRARFTGVASLAIASFFVLTAPALAQTKVWTTTADFNLGTLNNTSDTKFADEVVLGPTPVSQTHIVWSDNFNYGLIVRLDSVTGKQTSRFDSVLNTINGVSTGVRPANEFCNWSNTGNCPGRVAVDTNGDVWIVNRAFGNQGSLSKFSGDITHAHCIDRNNNGVIDTSNDKNGDGIIDMNPANGEYFGQNDECILTTIPVGANNAWPRAVAVDKRGKIWVGTFNEGKVYRFNPHEPVSLELTVTTGGQPYSMASGGDYMFVSNASGAVFRVNIQTGAVDTAPCPGNYGIVADPGGQVAWLGSWMNQATGHYRADFSVTPHTCTLMASGPGPTTAMTLDNEPAPGPYVWGTNYTQEQVSKWTPAGAYIGSYPAGGTAHSHGLSPDFQGNLWVVSDSANNQAMVSKLNPATGAILLSANIGYLAADQAKYPTNCSTGYCDGATPYLYSDFTGVQIDRQAPYTYVGTWSAVYDGGVANIPWSTVKWNTEPQGAVPAETSLVVNVKAANSIGGLATASAVVATNGAALANVVGEFIQVTAALEGPGFVTSVLSDISVTGCGALGNGCCLQNSDCVPPDACHSGFCPAPGGACVFTAVPNCCLTVADCTTTNVCAVPACPTPGGTCQFPTMPNCCNTNADCTNTMTCNVNLCPVPGGMCSHTPIPGCCQTDMDCNHGNICSNATCPTPGGFCTGGPIPGCCEQNSDCNGADGGDLTCSEGACVSGCTSGEFPCPPNFVCVKDLCMPTDCSKIHCPAGQVCLPGSGTCVVSDGGVTSSSSSSSASSASGSSGAGGGAPDGGSSTSSSGSTSTSSGSSSSGGNPDKFGLATGGACHCGVVGSTGSEERGRLLVAALGLLVVVSRSRPRRRREAQELAQ